MRRPARERATLPDSCAAHLRRSLVYPQSARGGRVSGGSRGGDRTAATTFSWRAARCRRRCWSSRCSRRGLGRAACSPAPGSATAAGFRAVAVGRGVGRHRARLLLAPRVRRLAPYTVPDILEARYGAPARVLGTVTIVLAYTTIAAYQFRGGGRLLNLVPASIRDRRARHRRLLRRLHGARRHAVGGLPRRRERRDDDRRRRRGRRLPARPGRRRLRRRSRRSGPTSSRCSARCRPPKRSRCSCRRCSCCSAKRTCTRSSSRRATSARRARRRRLDRRHDRGRDADRRSACSAASPSPGWTAQSEAHRRARRGRTCCRPCSACCCWRRPPRSSCRRRTACCSRRRPAWRTTCTSASSIPPPAIASRPADAIAHRRARRRGARRRQLLSDDPRDGAVGLHDVRRRRSRRRCSPRWSGRARPGGRRRRRSPSACSDHDALGDHRLAHRRPSALGLQTIYPALVHRALTVAGHGRATVQVDRRSGRAKVQRQD